MASASSRPWSSPWPAQLEVELDPFDDRAQPFLLQPRALRGMQTVRDYSPEGFSAPRTLGLLDPLASGI
jgi:hypothetical protein